MTPGRHDENFMGGYVVGLRYVMILVEYTYSKFPNISSTRNMNAAEYAIVGKNIHNTTIKSTFCIFSLL
jgi:hypothetical protein